MELDEFIVLARGSGWRDDWCCNCGLRLWRFFGPHGLKSDPHVCHTLFHNNQEWTFYPAHCTQETHELVGTLDAKEELLATLRELEAMG